MVPDKNTQNKEEIENQIFNETYKKQAEKARKTSGIIFGVMGAVFLLLGIVLVFTLDDEIGLVYCILGAVLLFIALLFAVLIPKNYNYGKYKTRVNNYGGINIYEILARLNVLEKRVNELEDQLKNNEAANGNGEENRQ